MASSTVGNHRGFEIALKTARGDLTIREAATRAGVDPSTWYRIETGRSQPSFPTVAAIRATFVVDVNLVAERHLDGTAARHGRGVIGGGPTPAKERAASTTKGE